MPSLGLKPDTGQMGTAYVGRTGALGRSPRNTVVLSREQVTRARGKRAGRWGQLLPWRAAGERGAHEPRAPVQWLREGRGAAGLRHGWEESLDCHACGPCSACALQFNVV